MTLRFITYLAPSLPASLFQAIVAHVAAETGVSTSLAFETASSGESTPPRSTPMFSRWPFAARQGLPCV